jgi:hypothetical protein
MSHVDDDSWRDRRQAASLLIASVPLGVPAGIQGEHRILPQGQRAPPSITMLP